MHVFKTAKCIYFILSGACMSSVCKFIGWCSLDVTNPYNHNVHIKNLLLLPSLSLLFALSYEKQHLNNLKICELLYFNSASRYFIFSSLLAVVEIICFVHLVTTVAVVNAIPITEQYIWPEQRTRNKNKYKTKKMISVKFKPFWYFWKALHYMRSRNRNAQDWYEFAHFVFIFNFSFFFSSFFRLLFFSYDSY